MPVYPIALRKKSMLHRQGTKEYHQVLITNGEGRALLIQRWGRKNAEGTMDFDTFSDSGTAVRAFDQKDREKRARGYDHDPARDTIVECADEAEFRRKLGRMYLFKAGAANLDFISPGIDTTGVEEADPYPFETTRDGRVVRKGFQPKHTFTDFVEPAQPSVEEQVAENELWGMF
jgi:predicted DNA-binding WGR domain protein